MEGRSAAMWAGGLGLKYRFVFTLTAGRTGTEWLRRLLAENLGIPAIHEPLEIDDFGTRMPDIRLMRSFNDRGNTSLIQDFHAGKFAGLKHQRAYAETNHTLGKCGLVENLVALGLGGETCLVLLTRDLFAQCLSYLVRRDFTNATIVWQWYLHYAYRNIIVDTAPFMFLDDLGQAVWYAHEMQARLIYYESLFGPQVKMIRCSLEQLNTPHGAGALLSALGHPGTVRLPPPANRNVLEDEARFAERLRQGLAALDVDIVAMVRSYIARGRRLDAVR